MSRMRDAGSVLYVIAAVSAVWDGYNRNFKARYHCAALPVLIITAKAVGIIPLNLPKAFEGSIILFINISEVVGEEKTGCIGSLWLIAPFIW